MKYFNIDEIEMTNEDFKDKITSIYKKFPVFKFSFIFQNQKIDVIFDDEIYHNYRFFLIIVTNPEKQSYILIKRINNAILLNKYLPFKTNIIGDKLKDYEINFLCSLLDENSKLDGFWKKFFSNFKDENIKQVKSSWSSDYAFINEKKEFGVYIKSHRKYNERKMDKSMRYHLSHNLLIPERTLNILEKWKSTIITTWNKAESNETLYKQLCKSDFSIEILKKHNR